MNEKLSLEDNIDDLKKSVKELFPDMDEKTLEKNGIFIEMLNSYEEEDILWIEDFLEIKWYILEWIKYINGQKPRFTENQRKNILKWYYNIWVKSFYEVLGNGIEYDGYYIIARKKNKMWIDKIKDAISNLIWNKVVFDS